VGAESFAWGEHSAIATYDGLKAASGLIAAAYYEQPSKALDVVAITGTNGKTSTAWWLAHAMQNAGQRCALVGTLGVGELGQLEVTGMTTPDPVLQLCCLDASLAMRPVFAKYSSVFITSGTLSPLELYPKVRAQ
jgi:UDP-N-acetylmuramyl tripeptide synthase